MWWFFLGLLLFFWIIAGVSYHYAVTTALVIVHPWNFGRDEKEMAKSLRKMRQAGMAIKQSNLGVIIKDHLQYNSRLEDFLSSRVYGHLVLMEERSKDKSSIQRLEALLTKKKFFKLLRMLIGLDIIVVDTVNGHATPLDSSGWEGMVTKLRSMGVSRVHIIGSYLGLKDQNPVFEHDTRFCVNDAYEHLRGKFGEVLILPEACFRHNVEKCF